MTTGIKLVAVNSVVVVEVMVVLVVGFRRENDDDGLIMCCLMIDFCCRILSLSGDGRLVIE